MSVAKQKMLLPWRVSGNSCSSFWWTVVGCKVKVERNVEGKAMGSGPSVQQREEVEHLHPLGLILLFTLERTFNNRICIVLGEPYWGWIFILILVDLHDKHALKRGILNKITSKQYVKKKSCFRENLNWTVSGWRQVSWKSACCLKPLNAERWSPNSTFLLYRKVSGRKSPSQILFLIIFKNSLWIIYSFLRRFSVNITYQTFVSINFHKQVYSDVRVTSECIVFINKWPQIHPVFSSGVSRFDMTMK
jgi:hypothetical protein